MITQDISSVKHLPR